MGMEGVEMRGGTMGTMGAKGEEGRRDWEGES